MKARVVQRVDGQELAKHVFAMVDTSAHLQTDHAISYKKIGEHYASHKRIAHNAGSYVRYTADGVQVTTNRIEGFWANLTCWRSRLNGHGVPECGHNRTE